VADGDLPDLADGVDFAAVDAFRPAGVRFDAAALAVRVDAFDAAAGTAGRLDCPCRVAPSIDTGTAAIASASTMAMRPRNVTRFIPAMRAIPPVTQALPWSSPHPAAAPHTIAHWNPGIVSGAGGP
jgi:hypothetical protein